MKITQAVKEVSKPRCKLQTWWSKLGKDEVFSRAEILKGCGIHKSTFHKAWRTYVKEPGQTTMAMITIYRGAGGSFYYGRPEAIAALINSLGRDVRWGLRKTSCVGPLTKYADVANQPRRK